jgi:diguanylate cyclase (GGDEF)-like protein
LFDQVGKQLGQAIFNARLHEKVKVQAITDNLTGAYNRHYLDDFLNIELKRSQRYKRAMAVAMLDMDHFKQCNDDGGHLSGDRALREAVKLMSLGVRSVDLVARFGGEEFVIVMPETDAQGALEVAQRLRALIEGHDFPCGKLTASIGVASWDFSNGSGPASVEEMLAQADQALFMAKQAGRNQVKAWEIGGA